MMLTEAQRLLTREDARKLVLAAGKTVCRIVRVCDDDSILFLNGLKRPWTAWISPHPDDPAQVHVQFEEGWSAEFASLAAVSTPIAARFPGHTTQPDAGPDFTD